MVRNLHVYPKAIIDPTGWRFVVKVADQDTGSISRFVHTEAAGVSVTRELRLLKLGFDLVVADTDTDQDVDDALYVDDIKPGAQTETVWGNWRDTAESKLTGDPTLDVFWAAWSRNDTVKIRNDARRALVTQRGWTIPAGSVHQHEGDGTVTEE